MIFHVINRETGEVVRAKGFFAIGEDGVLYDVQDGWGCEGGGGSDVADSRYAVVLGPEPEPVKVIVLPPINALKPYRCAICNKSFATQGGFITHQQAKGHFQ